MVREQREDCNGFAFNPRDPWPMDDRSSRARADRPRQSRPPQTIEKKYWIDPFDKTEN